MGELHQGAPSIIPGATLTAAFGPSCMPQHLQGQGLQTDKRRLQHGS